MKNLENLIMAAYHNYQWYDLHNDLENKLVKPNESKDWNEGWGQKCFDPTLIVPVPAPIINTQLQAYQTAMDFHAKKRDFFKALIPIDLDIRVKLPNFDDFCSVFPFGTEPSLEQILMFLLTKKIIKERVE